MSANAARLDRARARAAARLSGWCEVGTCTDKDGNSTGRCLLKGCAHECHQDSDAGVHAGTPEAADAKQPPVVAAPIPHGTGEVPDEAKGLCTPASASDIKPGLHFDLPNEDYHSLTGWWSSTQLKRALPERYKEGGSQEALDFGTLVHTVVLEPDNLSGYVVLDAAAVAGNNPKTGRPYDSPTMTAKWKAAVAEAEQDGLTVVSQADWETAHRMRDAILAHDQASGLLFGDSGGICEESAFVTDEQGIRHKARFDKRIPGGIIDLKTTASKPGADSLARTIVDYGYDLSAVHYLTVAELLELDVQGFTWVFVDKSDQHRVSVVAAGPDWIERGRTLREQALRRLTDPAEPPYEGASGYLEVPVPGWARLTTTSAGIPADFTWSIYDNA